uniref:Multidrug and toxin extrusion protein n=1 Tax=Odontella aurita TaxID=265563 RepID=A0A7S4JX28_9STRA|mmetsp:Transcript_56048/g.167777  ORF Transcript_56048/g.167777 Transcript_56048/m.167777 type:complete len:1199 (+) Transcript_56048:291-3887(+)|eukprot:CAMPEP_0113530732 /NCGR_PEP_ID=MMETSP0015_2-20120614/3110_1 /TAXON_ID=2838 /ORGANISM="Odontella" /LENGTH=1198 /DNA_ID=CAMNT_0000429501 /DNA_START=219 /DNA_END=3815 /DNA_ORIENTATION=+ /assembly_acc=CAM_ASM_000160
MANNYEYGGGRRTYGNQANGDPGPWLSWLTTAYAVFVILAVVPLVIMTRKIKKARKARKRTKGIMDHPVGGDTESPSHCYESHLREKHASGGLEHRGCRQQPLSCMVEVVNVGEHNVIMPEFDGTFDAVVINLEASAACTACTCARPPDEVAISVKGIDNMHVIDKVPSEIIVSLSPFESKSLLKKKPKKALVRKIQKEMFSFQKLMTKKRDNNMSGYTVGTSTGEERSFEADGLTQGCFGCTYSVIESEYEDEDEEEDLEEGCCGCISIVIDGDEPVGTECAKNSSEDGLEYQKHEEITNFDDYDWKELPATAKDAAEKLGYTQSIWDSSGHSACDNMDWAELTLEQQAAASILGYSQEIWDNDGESHQAGHIAGTEGDKGDTSNDQISYLKYEDEDRCSRDIHAKSQTENELNLAQPAPGDIKQSDLNEPSEEWDDEEEEGFYDDYDWNELSAKVQDAARVLGYNQRIWDDGGKALSEEKDWNELTEAEQNAAMTLGYNSIMWDREDSYGMAHQNSINANRGWRATFKTVARIDKESQKLMRIAVPATFETMGDSITYAVVMAMISKNLGSSSLVAFVLVEACLSVFEALYEGLEEAQEACVSHCIGLGDFFMAGQYTRLAATIFALVTVPIFTTLIIFVDEIFLLLDLDENIAEAVSSISPIMALSHLIHGSLAGPICTLMGCDGKLVQIAVIDTIFNILHVATIAAVTMYFKAGLLCVAWAELLSTAAYTIFILYFFNRNMWLRRYKKGLKWRSMKNKKLVARFTKMATPLTFGAFLSTGEWNVLAFFAASIGAEEVAAWSVLGAIWDLFGCLSEGIGSAAIIRIGFHLGKANPYMAKISAYKSILIVFFWSSYISVLFFGLQDQIISFFTDDAYLASVLAPCIGYIGIGNITLSLGLQAWYIITGQSRTKIATAIYFLCIWCVSLPLAGHFVFANHYGVQSLASSITIGFSTAASALLLVVFTTNWTKLSMHIISKTKLLSSFRSQNDMEDGDYVAPENANQRKEASSGRRKAEDKDVVVTNESNQQPFSEGKKIRFAEASMAKAIVEVHMQKRASARISSSRSQSHKSYRSDSALPRSSTHEEERSRSAELSVSRSRKSDSALHGKAKPNRARDPRAGRAASAQNKQSLKPGMGKTLANGSQKRRNIHNCEKTPASRETRKSDKSRSSRVTITRTQGIKEKRGSHKGTMATT